MASVNRYTQRQNTTYEPRTLQELMMVPAYKRKQHDEINAGIAEYETQLAQADGLDIHNTALQEEQDRLYKQMIAQRDKLDSQGFNQSAKSDFIRFNKEYQQAIGPQGKLGKIGAAKTAYDTNKAAGIQTLIKQGYNPNDAADEWTRHSQIYNDSFDGKNITNIGELYGTGFRDPVAEAQKLMGEVGYTSEMLKNDLGTGKIITDENGTYVATSKFYEKHGSNASQLKGVLDYYNKQVRNPNSEVGQSLRIQQRNPDQVMDEILGLEAIYNKTETDKGSGRTISSLSPASSIGVPFVNGNLAHESAPAQNVNLKQAEYITKLDNIVNDITVSGGVERSDEGDFSNNYGISRSPDTPPTFEGNFRNEEDLLEYKSLFKKLQEANPDLKDFEWDSKNAAETVSSYLKSNSNIVRQDIVITDDFVTDYGDRSVGITKTNPTKIAGAVKANRELRRYSINGKVMSYNDLPSEIKKDFDNVRYSGYYSPKNFMTDNYGSFQDKKLFVTPIKMQYTNKKGELTEILVSRSQGEMENPAFKADMLFNDIFVNTNKYPGLTYQIPGSNDEIIYYPEGVPIPGAPSDSKYLVNQKRAGNYNKPLYLSEESLQNRLYQMFGVMNPSDIKAQNKAAQKAENKRN